MVAKGNRSVVITPVPVKRVKTSVRIEVLRELRWPRVVECVIRVFLVASIGVVPYEWDSGQLFSQVRGGTGCVRAWSFLSLAEVVSVESFGKHLARFVMLPLRGAIEAFPVTTFFLSTYFALQSGSTTCSSLASLTVSSLESILMEKDENLRKVQKRGEIRLLFTNLRIEVKS
jgi:hypothetical protein